MLNMVRSMMSLTKLPMSFWGYALESVVRILNMVPTKKDTQKKGYYFYYLLEENIFVARDAKFDESGLISQEASGSTVDFDEIRNKDTLPSKNTRKRLTEVEPESVIPYDDETPVRISTRISSALHRYGFNIEAKEKEDRYSFYINYEEHELGDHGEHSNFKVSLLDPEFDKWLEAMNVEMQFVNENQVWSLVNLSPNGKTKNPGEIHWTDVKNILKYLRNTKDMFLVYGGDLNGELRVTCVVDWKSAKQITIDMSSTDAEYIAASKAAMEAV
ncbi:hypothetical protein Tco_0492281 [Tanacetum coccineum]